MLSHKGSFLFLVGFCVIMSLGPNNCPAQNSLAEFHQTLSNRASFTQTDFTVLGQNEPVVKLLPTRDKREVVVAGLVPLQAPAELFLQSFRESMTRKNNPAILEIGSFSNPPTLADLEFLTFDDRDLEDLKDCVVGNCRMKLSAMMIDRLKEVDWTAPDYRAQATQLLKLMLLDYVRDYLVRGEAALIQYNDKQTPVRLADEHRELAAALGSDLLADIPSYLNGVSSALPVVERALVWSKIKFGLKPVIAINQITIYRRQQESGPQILVASKQIYANHYFDSSLALTVFLSIPGAASGAQQSYLFYENRSRADGLGGMFGNLKRGMIENRALDSVKAILHQSRLSLEARALNRPEPETDTAGEAWSLKRWKVSRMQIFLLSLCFIAVLVLVGRRGYNWKIGITGATQ